MARHHFSRKWRTELVRSPSPPFTHTLPTTYETSVILWTSCQEMAQELFSPRFTSLQKGTRWLATRAWQYLPGRPTRERCALPSARDAGDTRSPPECSTRSCTAHIRTGNELQRRNNASVLKKTSATQTNEYGHHQTSVALPLSAVGQHTSTKCTVHRVAIDMSSILRQCIRRM